VGFAMGTVLYLDGEQVSKRLLTAASKIDMKNKCCAMFTKIRFQNKRSATEEI
jgi:hypothetical protein